LKYSSGYGLVEDLKTPRSRPNLDFLDFSSPQLTHTQTNFLTSKDLTSKSKVSPKKQDTFDQNRTTFRYFPEHFKFSLPLKHTFWGIHKGIQKGILWVILSNIDLSNKSSTKYLNLFRFWSKMSCSIGDKTGYLLHTFFFTINWGKGGLGCPNFL